MYQARPLFSNTISWLRFPLAFLVVMIHNNPLSINIALDEEGLKLYEQYPIYCHIFHVVTNNLSRLAVPLFFFFSGYLFFMKFKDGFYKQLSIGEYWVSKIKKDLTGIVLPYFIYNAIYIAFNLLIQTFLASYLSEGGGVCQLYNKRLAISALESGRRSIMVYS